MNQGYLESASSDTVPLSEQLDRLRTAGIRTIRLLYSDLHGLARGKDIPLEMFDPVSQEGMAFAAVIFALDLANNLCPLPGFGSDLGYPDVRVKPRLDTLRPIPWEQHIACCLGDIAGDAGPSELSPRTILQRVEQRYYELGYQPIIGPELEFFLLRRDEDGRLHRYVDHPAMCYTAGGRSDPQGVVRELWEAARSMNLHVLAANHEFSPGQFEINLMHGEALDAADRIFVFKWIAKEVAARGGLLATFMGRPLNDDGGSGFHIHLSLRDQQGQNAFAPSDAAEDGLSALARHFLAGVLEHASALMAFLCPTINAYKRLVPNSFVPLAINWGHANRTVFIRVPADRGPGTRVEVRVADGTANPYLAFAVILLAGLDGIQRTLEPPPPVSGDSSTSLPLDEALPRTLDASLAALRADRYLCDGVGYPLLEAFSAIKASELARFGTTVTEWEHNEYLWHL